jgi:Protein of unknown function (DUF2793)
MADATTRLALPFIIAGQAQKEVTHNEALLRLDALVQSSVEALGLDTPPPRPTPGQSWIVGDAPTGPWAGQAGAIASFAEAGWRFISPLPGMSVWSKADSVFALRTETEWILGRMPQLAVHIGGNQVVGPRQPALASPNGGTTIDGEARVVIDQILATLRNHGLIAS